jgi:hypothetical protein
MKSMMRGAQVTSRFSKMAILKKNLPGKNNLGAASDILTPGI